MRVLGFMTGTSLDAVDMAVLETDGEAILGFGPAGERKLSPATRSVVEAGQARAGSGLGRGWTSATTPRNFDAMDAKIDHPRAIERASSPRVGEYDIVRLVRNVVGPEGSFEKGSTGTIVHVHRDGVALEVEIVAPVHAVVTVEAADVERLTA